VGILFVQKYPILLILKIQYVDTNSNGMFYRFTIRGPHTLIIGNDPDLNRDFSGRIHGQFHGKGCVVDVALARRVPMMAEGG